MTKVYTVKEVFYTLQGEGCHGGKPAVFVRFAGCNLWTGQEADRPHAICQFCDTDFVGGTKYTLDELVLEIGSHFCNFIVFTGGEPCLQLDADLIRALHRRHKYIAVETNGTLPVPPGVDWICVSPKANTAIRQKDADEVKLVFPQQALMPDAVRTQIVARHLWLSPMDGPDLQRNMEAAINYAKLDRRWRVNIQAHKVWGIR